MTTSKWDKISKRDAAPFIEQINMLSFRDSERFNCYDLHGLDIYNPDSDPFRNTFTVEKVDTFEFLGEEMIHSKHSKLVPTIAEMFAQLPRRYAHKVNGVRINLMRGHDDVIEGTHKICVEFYQRKEAGYVRQGPLTARQMYIDILKDAMNERGDQKGMLQYSSLPDATRDRSWMAELRKKLEEAEQMTDSEISDAVASFWLKAFRQR